MMRKGHCFGKGGRVITTVPAIKRGTVRSPDRRSLTQPASAAVVPPAPKESNPATSRPRLAPSNMRKGGMCR